MLVVFNAIFARITTYPKPNLNLNIEMKKKNFVSSTLKKSFQKEPIISLP